MINPNYNFIFFNNNNNKEDIKIKNKRIRWTKEEDDILLLAISKEGTKDWTKISKYFKNRTSIQCRERYIIHHDPNYNHDEFTQEEDLKLINFHNLIGNKWSLISKRIIGRSPKSLKNRFKTLEKRKFNLDSIFYKPKIEENSIFNLEFDDENFFEFF